MLSHDDDPIIALCTAQGKGALALIRMSGTGVRQLADSMALLASQKSITQVPTHTIHFGRIISQTDQTIDQVMIIVMDGPRTFTGQDVIEITCHNNSFVIEAIIARAIEKGARLAQEGEFSKRAYLAGKMDLLQAEALNELIGAQTQGALKTSLSQLEGSFSQWISLLEKDLIKAISWCEASFEFLDEQKEFGTEIREYLDQILAKIARIKKTFGVQQQLRQGIRIALIGSVNAGKSSLFNALLHQNRAIVTDVPGTTRDVIEGGLTRNGFEWTVIDTAGLRQTHDIIEKEGIRRSYEEAQKADIILLVIDGNRPLHPEEHEVYSTILEQLSRKCIFIQNKADLPSCENPLLAQCHISISTVTHENLENLYAHIEQKIAALFESLDSPYLLNMRHQQLLNSLEQKIHSTLKLLTVPIHYELISYHLQDAATLLSELTGKSISEASLDQVFKEFCVGK
jgi:tRNA modification GTPase